jgi:general secretion pathway protein L
MSLFIVCLPRAEAALSTSYDYLRATGGFQSGAPAESGSATATLLPTPSRGAELVVVVPASAMSWHAVELPAGLSATSSRLRAVLGGLLEDRLLDDDERLHFALAPAAGTAPGGQTWVVACDKAWLQAHLLALEAAGQPASRVVPELSPDAGPLQLHAVEGSESASWIITGDAVGGLMSLPFSAAALSVIPTIHEQPAVAVFAEPSLAAQAERFTQSNVSLVTRAQRWLDAAGSPWDLAQFDLARSARSRTVKKISNMASGLLRERRWRPARWGAGAFLLANLVGLNVWAWQQNAQLAATRAAIQGTLTQTFPSVRVVVDAPLQMQREVNLLRQASGAMSGGDLEAMLGALALAAPASRLSSIDFSSGELRVKGLADNAQDAQGAATLLKAKGYIAQFDGDTYVVKSSDKAAP